MKKPKLTVVPPTPTTTPSSPASLGATGTTLWKKLTSEFHFDDAAGREMLLQICTAADRADEYAATIAADGGPVIHGRAGLKEHPLIKHELSARNFIVRSLHKLGLDIEPPRAGPGRPLGTFPRTR
jgi:hypothetical protein